MPSRAELLRLLIGISVVLVLGTFNFREGNQSEIIHRIPAFGMKSDPPKLAVRVDSKENPWLPGLTIPDLTGVVAGTQHEIATGGLASHLPNSENDSSDVKVGDDSLSKDDDSSTDRLSRTVLAQQALLTELNNEVSSLRKEQRSTKSKNLVLCLVTILLSGIVWLAQTSQDRLAQQPGNEDSIRPWKNAERHFAFLGPIIIFALEKLL